jgi:Fe-S-cluster containining protein
MSTKPQPSVIPAKVTLTVHGRRLDLTMSVPNAKVPASAMLPLFRKVAEDFLDMGIADGEAAGNQVSCQKGCGACCRQLVPISPIEAREIARVVQQMEPTRRATILQRFASARRRLRQEEMLEALSQPDQHSNEHMRILGREYFQLGIACPFLEDESCSIYHDRPITCREYLVTSPPEHCAFPTAENISMVDLPAGPVWTAVARFDQSTGGRLPWVPLILALEFAAASTDEPEKRPGKQWAQEFIARIAGRSQNTQKNSTGVSPV